MQSAKAFNGWALDAALEIDRHYAGFAGHVLRASNERRHVIAAYLSLQQPVCTFAPADMGEFLSSAGHDDIIEAGFGARSPQLRAALARGGSQPYARRFYAYLHALLISPNRRGTQRVVASLVRVNPTRLKIVRALPDRLKHATLVELLQSVDQARDLTTLVRLLATAGADEIAMSQALRLIRKPEDLRRFARRWSLRVRFPDHPVAGSENYSPIRDGEQLDAMARNFRNCARTYTAALLEGRSAFAVVRIGEHRGVVHLTRHEQTWYVEDIYGPQNGEPDEKVVRTVTNYLSGSGIYRRYMSRSHSEWSCLRRIAGHFAPEEW